MCKCHIDFHKSVRQVNVYAVSLFLGSRVNRFIYLYHRLFFEKMSYNIKKVYPVKDKPLDSARVELKGNIVWEFIEILETFPNQQIFRFWERNMFAQKFII